MFAPLLFTDHKRDRYKGSLDVLWGLQMFLTNSMLFSNSHASRVVRSVDHVAQKYISFA